MNRTRVAALLRELADELERDDAPESPRPKGRRRAQFVVPENDIEPDDVTAARADRLLRRAGVAPRG